MYKFHFFQHTLKDGEDLGGGDRGDELPADDDKITDEERKLAEDLKAKAAAAKDKDSDETDEEKEKKKDTRVPLNRHKELLEAERTERAKVEARLALYEKGADVAKTNEELTKAEDRLLGMEKEHAKLLNDGKVEEAAAKMSEIRKLERDVNDIRTDLKTAAAESRAYERARYDTTVERIQAAYPVLNDDNKDHEDPAMRFDPVVVRKVLSIAKAYQGDGLTPSAALQEAVKDLLGDPKTAKQKEAVDVKPRVDEAAVKKAQREEEARRKAAEASGKTPPGANGLGKESDKLGGGGTLSGADVMKLNYADFVKLDESTLSRLRGDLPE